MNWFLRRQWLQWRFWMLTLLQKCSLCLQSYTGALFIDLKPDFITNTVFLKSVLILDILCCWFFLWEFSGRSRTEARQVHRFYLFSLFLNFLYSFHDFIVLVMTWLWSGGRFVNVKNLRLRSNNLRKLVCRISHFSYRIVLCSKQNLVHIISIHLLCMFTFLLLCILEIKKRWLIVCDSLPMTSFAFLSEATCELFVILFKKVTLGLRHVVWLPTRSPCCILNEHRRRIQLKELFGKLNSFLPIFLLKYFLVLLGF